jgi:hypothetical protein
MEKTFHLTSSATTHILDTPRIHISKNKIAVAAKIFFLIIRTIYVKQDS